MKSRSRLKRERDWSYRVRKHWRDIERKLRAAERANSRRKDSE